MTRLEDPVAPGLPDKKGFYWARWMKASPGTVEGDELTPAPDWEIVDVFENHIDPGHPEHLRVHVSGVQQGQALENFKWGPRVPRPGGLA